MRRRLQAAVRTAAAALVLVWASAISAGHLTWLDRDTGSLFYAQRDGLISPEKAVLDLLAGPTDSERAAGVVSAIPDGVTLLDLRLTEEGVVIDLSAEAAEGLDDARSDAIFRQFLFTMAEFGLDSRVEVLVDGRLLSDYLPPPPPAIFSAPFEVPLHPQGQPKTLGLAGKRITLSEGHGYLWTGSAWATQRGIVCGNPQEDFRNLRLARYLRVFLENAGAYVQHTREHDLNQGNGPSGHPWWQQAAYLWLRNQGYACTVYASSSGICSDTGSSHRSADDIRSRPLASNLDSRGDTDIFLSIHTNALHGACYSGCPSGTGTYYMDEGEHAAWGASSKTLAGHITLAVVAAANEADTRRGDGAPWQCHGSCAPKYGNFGEIRIPQRPAALIELGFHDSCNTDAAVMDKPFFQSVTMWGMHKGVCDYFGVTPSWPLYASELVSTTIPEMMVTGETVEVEITFRNKSVLWHRDYGFKLAAGGDSDPFAAIRHDLGSATIDNNGTHTFRFPFTAPSAPGAYETSWQMIREGHRRFGATLTHTVQVAPSCNCLPGEIEQSPCGECGVRERVCQEDCLWGDYGPCVEETAGDECDTGLAGACAFGLWACVDRLVECVPLTPPRDEICDGIDNLCNGSIDDGFPSELGDPPPPYAADLIESNAPTTLLLGQRTTVSASFRNVGSRPWPAGSVSLVHLPPTDEEQPVFGGPWSETGAAALNETAVAPGESTTFRFDLFAPTASGLVRGTFWLTAPDGTPIACPVPLVELEVEVAGRVVLEPIGGDEGAGEHVYATGSCACSAGTDTGSPTTDMLWALMLLWPALRFGSSLSARRA